MRLAFLFIYTLQMSAAHAEWAFSALRGQKLHVHSKNQVAQNVMVLVDNECLSQRGHKMSRHMRFEAHAVAAADSKALSAWSEDPCVRAIADNPKFYINATDELVSEQVGLTSIEHTPASRIFFHPLFGIRTSVTVGVVDTGIQLNHPDLVSRIWRGSQGELGYDFANDDADPSDDNGHGTHVAGIVGAQRGNGIGVRGVMGDWSKLMAVKTQGPDGGGLLSSLVNGIRWAADHGAEVINISIDGRDTNPILEDSIQYALSRGVTVVAAAGNEGQEISASNFITPVGYASSYLGFLGVGAFDALTLARPTFSNYSPRYVEISAPGAVGKNGILSTFNRSDYLALRGTSMSAPHVSGAAALAIGFMKTQGVALSPAEVESAIEGSAYSDPNLTQQFSGGRRLNLEGLGWRLLRQTVVDSDGGFGAP